MASGHRSFGRSTRHAARPDPSSRDDDAPEEGSIDEQSGPARKPFGRSSRLSAQPVADPEGAAADDSDDTPDEGSVADSAASLLSISMRRRKPMAAAQPAPRRAAAPPKPRSPIEAWSLARRNQPYPAPADIDDATVTSGGYQGVLVRCAEDGRFLQVRRVFGSAMPSAGPAEDPPRWEEQNTAMVLEWLSTLGREAVRAGGPVEAADVFPSRRTGVPWRAIVLPLSTTGGDLVDTLLCCVRMDVGH
jgi:hypothetical protein